MNLKLRKELLQVAISAAFDAGKEIIEVYNSSDFEVQLKSDDSPLTLADQKAHKVIVAQLSQFDVPILSEEGEHLDFQTRKNWKHCWIVDPLDGTKEFIKRNNEFTVNIALVENGVPVQGVIYVPVYQQLYFADEQIGAYRMDQIENWDEEIEELFKNSKSLPCRTQRDKYIVVGSRSHMNQETTDYISQLPTEGKELEMISKGSSLKLCMIAEGEADVYPRYAPTMEWDTAAGHAIVTASGGKVTHVDSDKNISYNKEDLLNPWFICKR